MIGRVVLLADQSAWYNIAGLSQLDRLLRTLEECFAPGPGQDLAPEIVVFWRNRELAEPRLSKLPVTHQVAGSALDVAPGARTLVIRTNVVFRRRALAGLLRGSTSQSAFGILGPERFPARWEELAAAVSEARTDDSVWVLDGPGDAPKIERELVRTTGKATDGLVSRTLNRPISQRLSRLLVQTAVTPDQISLGVLAVLVASIWTLTRGTPLGFVIGMLLFHLASVLDGCDGEIARAKFLESRRGAWLDTSVDLLGNFMLPMAIGLGLSRQAGLANELRSDYLMEGILTSVGIAIGVLGVARARPAGRADFNDFGATAVQRIGMPRRLTALLQGAVDLARRDSYVLLFLLLAVLGRPEWILHFLAIGIALHLPVIAWSWWKSARIPAPLKARDRP